MMKIKLLFKSLLLSFFLFLGSTILANSVSAAKLYLSPSEKSIAKSTEFEVNLVIDTEGTQVFGAEAKIIYPSSDLELKSVTNGGFFTDFSSPGSSGLIEIRGYFSNLYDAKSGSGNLAVLKFLTKKDSGSGVISFDCGGTQILDNGGINILSCGTLNQANLTFGSATGGTETATNPPSQGEPNSCGGTCGSNSNCKSEYYCYQGYCRNPACPTSTNCICSVTTPKPTVKPKTSPIASATPQIITLEEYATPSGKIEETPVPEIQETEETTAQAGFNIIKYLPYLAIVFFIILLAVILSKIRKNKNQIPPINPPVPQPPQVPQSPEPTQNLPENPTPPQTPPVNQENKPFNPPTQTPDNPNSTV